MFDIIETMQKLIKIFGLSVDTMDLIEKSVDFKKLTGKKTKLIYYKLINYLNEELSKFTISKGAYLASSEVIESIFGKYKFKLTDRLGGIYSSILVIPVICSNIDSQDIKTATQTYKMQDIDNWFNQMNCDNSIRINRRLAFNNTG